MKAKIKFIALGGGQTIGASCYFLQIGEHRILLDCGKGVSGNLCYGPNLDALYKIDGIESISQIDTIFISHGHYDHVGYIAEITEKCKNTPVYATEITKLFAKHLIDEKTAEERASLPLEKQVLVDNKILFALEHITPIGYYSKTKAKKNVEVTFYEAGHIPGAAMIYIECENRKILYTGDFSSVSTPLANKFILPDNISPDTIIVCGVHAKHPMYKFSEDISYKLRQVNENLKYNLPVHIGVKQLTKGIELIQFVREILPNKDIPIYLDTDIWRLAEKIELRGNRILDKNCGCYDFAKEYKPKGIYIGAEKYNKNFRYNHSVDFSLHSTYADIKSLLEKYKPETAIVVHTAADRENRYNNILADEFPDINVIYAENSDLYEF